MEKSKKEELFKEAMEQRSDYAATPKMDDIKRERKGRKRMSLQKELTKMEEISQMCGEYADTPRFGAQRAKLHQNIKAHVVSNTKSVVWKRSRLVNGAGVVCPNKASMLWLKKAVRQNDILAIYDVVWMAIPILILRGNAIRVTRQHRRRLLMMNVFRRISHRTGFPTLSLLCGVLRRAALLVCIP